MLCHIVSWCNGSDYDNDTPSNHMLSAEVFHWWLTPINHDGLATLQKCGSILVQVTVYSLRAPCHYLNQCWLISCEVCHSAEGNFTGSSQGIYTWYKQDIFTHDNSTLVWVMIWVLPGSKPLPGHCCDSFISLYGTTRPKWGNMTCFPYKWHQLEDLIYLCDILSTYHNISWIMIYNEIWCSVNS